MAKIKSLIPLQRFELVRDQLGRILAEELLAQFGFHGRADWNPRVWVERFIPVDKTEIPAIIVYLEGGSYDNKDAVSVTGTYNYYIDCLTARATTTQVWGDKAARMDLQRIMGMCRAILENPVYRTLDFAAPFLSGVAVTAIQISDPNERHEATNQAYGRLTVSVTVEEVTSMDADRVPLAGSSTSVHLEETDKGFVYLANSTLILGTHNNIPIATDNDELLTAEPPFS